MTQLNHRKLFFIFLFATFSCTSQDTIQTKPFPIKNVPEHIFKININTLKDTIVTFFKIENSPEENKLLSKIFYYYSDSITIKILFSAETNKDTLFSKAYFSQPNTSNDIFLNVYHTAWISKFYYSKDHPLKYTTDFVFKLSPIDSGSTDLKVVAINPEVINGTGFGVHGPMNIYTKAHSTTIEEYSLLLFIADKLGGTTLSPLKIPSNQ